MTQRPIKFRVYEHRTKAWRYDFFLQSDGIVRDALGVLEPESHTVVLFTGLTDKHGKEIWEGDVVQDEDSKWEVKFYDGAFWFCDNYGNSGDYDWLKTNKYWNHEVIGNIYKNPELLKL